MKKRLTAFLLAAILCLGMLPATALAAPVIGGTYSEGVVTVEASGLTPNLDYHMISIYDDSNNGHDWLASGGDTADADGNLTTDITTGEISDIADHYVYIYNNSDGSLVGKGPLTIPVSSYAVTVTVNKDGAAWTTGVPAITLEPDTGGSIVSDLGAVPNGTYKILADGVDTGKTVEVNGAAANAVLDYFTVSFAVTDAGDASGSTISATYNGVAVSSGDVVLGGKALVITAAGAGATSYTYAWAGAGTSGDTTATLTISSLSEAVNATCTVTGSTDPTKAPTPTGVGKTDETAAGANDGTLTGLTTDMEYKLSTATDWTACTGSTVTGLAPGTYYVRTKGSGTTLPSDHVELVISAYVDPGVRTYTITASAGTGGTISPSGDVGVSAGDSKTFTISANSYYAIDKVLVDGVSQGKISTYTFSNVTENHTIAASFTYTGGGGGGGGGSSGGGGSANYSVTVDRPTGGTVKVTPTSASKGDTVTITVTPDSGYELDELTVTDRNGKEIALTDKGDGKYTFTMPASKVTVDASFAKIQEQAPVNPFTDVAPGSYYYDAVLWAVENGITSGTSATTFSPRASCTRAQTVTFLWRAAGSPAASGTNPFTDVSPNAYYYDAVLWAVQNGITNGTSATTFSPDAVVTRGQNVTFLWRWAGSLAADQSNSFTDVASDAYYYDAVLWAADEGVTAGTSATTFSPDDPCLRSQIVTFLYRYMVE